MALQTVLDFIARQQRYCHERQTADNVDVDVNVNDASCVTPELPHPNVLRCDDGGVQTAESGRPCSLMQLRSLIPSHDDDVDGDDSSRDADHSDDGVDDEDVVAHRGFATGWLPVRRRPGHVDFNHSEVTVGSLILIAVSAIFLGIV